MSSAVEQADMSESTVTFGDVSFDPVAIQDFRLSVEGTSGAEGIETDHTDAGLAIVLTFRCEYCGASNENTAIMGGDGDG